MERAEVAKATSHAGEMEQEISLLRDDHEQVGLISTIINSYFMLWSQKCFLDF